MSTTGRKGCTAIQGESSSSRLNHPLPARDPRPTAQECGRRGDEEPDAAESGGGPVARRCARWTKEERPHLRRVAVSLIFRIARIFHEFRNDITLTALRHWPYCSFYGHDVYTSCTNCVPNKRQEFTLAGAPSAPYMLCQAAVGVYEYTRLCLPRISGAENA